MTGPISRRRALTTIASAGAVMPLAAALPALAAAAEPDPIFAAIEKHKAAYSAFVDAAHHDGELEETLPWDRRQSSITAYETEIVDTDAPEWVAAKRRTMATADAMYDSAIDLLDVAPTTVAGVIALLAYAAEAEDLWPDDLKNEDGRPHSQPWHHFLCRSLAKALAEITTRSS